MSVEHLLLWLSARVQGSWSQFRGAVEELCAEQYDDSLDAGDDSERPDNAGWGLSVYQRVRFALQQLAHVEFFSNQAGHDWRVVPPTLALFPESPGKGLLCGARSPDLLQRLVSDLEVDRETAPGMPDRVVVRGSSQALARGAARLGLLVQAEAPTAILSAVPGVRDPSTWFPLAVPETPGWTVHRFSSSRLYWAAAAAKDALNARTGLFRFVMGHQYFYYLRWRTRSYRVPVQVGKYVVMQRRRGLLAYDIPSRTLSVPAVCRPPLLIERALVLCSGFLPSFNPRSRRLEYSNILPKVARLAAQLLHQEIAR